MDLTTHRPRRVVVTGATGLLGSNTVRRLLDLGSEVTAVVRNPEPARSLLPDHKRLDLWQGDVLDVRSIARVLPGHDAVIHTAAYFREYYAPGGRDDALLTATNVDAVGELLRAAADAGVPVVVHTSSIGTLGTRPDGRPSDEDTPEGRRTRENGYYASKLSSEEVVRSFDARHGVRVPMVLPGWMWGPGDAGPTSAGRLFTSVARGELRAVPRAGNHVVDARDVADACVRAAVAGEHARRYIVAGTWVTLPEVCRLAARAAGVAPPREVPAHLALAVAAVLEATARLRGRTPPATREGVRALLEGNRRRVSSSRAVSELGVTFRPLHRTLHDQADWHRAYQHL
ncbi:dihydroflavonol-4-reductase [Streptomyces albiflavescens]|uniref:Dihydroflavonol-4-reductase n=1 Tax=Streptomyces albiflavescens TaxID=1623582 RepID=A0A917XZT5_9ACTN|nr:NAD-dependent epimerase/dehydratase family protein [Streptomyces albiflavescens]GGN59982.1 dihydroflavonol-4-reductase [Streptomyces albiflavescens]